MAPCGTKLVTGEPFHYGVQRRKSVTQFFGKCVSLIDGRYTYGNLVTCGNGFWKYWEHYLEEASEAERLLWHHHGNVIPFEQTDFVMLGQKSALIKMSAALYASLTNRWEILDTIEKGLISVATGVQIIDDLLDWEEDEKAKIFTYPLVLAKQHCEAKQTLSESMNTSAVVLAVLKTATENLEQAKQSFKNVNAPSMVIFIDSLLQNLSTARWYVESENSLTKCSEFKLIEYIRHVITPKMTH
jgi:geranylgeranyl pyrophosphate synthase